jgi:hypothetical protein
MTFHNSAHHIQPTALHDTRTLKHLAVENKKGETKDMHNIVIEKPPREQKIKAAKKPNASPI